MSTYSLNYNKYFEIVVAVVEKLRSFLSTKLKIVGVWGIE